MSSFLNNHAPEELVQYLLMGQGACAVFFFIAAFMLSGNSYAGFVVLLTAFLYGGAAGLANLLDNISFRLSVSHSPKHALH